MITSSGSSKKRKVPLQHSIHRRVNQAYSPTEDVTRVAPAVRSRPPTPRTPPQPIALLCTCSFLGGPGTQVPGACATSSLCQDTGRPCGQPGPLHGLGLRGRFLRPSAPGQLLFFGGVASPWLGGWACGPPGCLSDRVECGSCSELSRHMCSAWHPCDFRAGPLHCADSNCWMAQVLIQTLLLWLREWRRLLIYSFDPAPTDPLIPGSHP